MNRFPTHPSSPWLDVLPNGARVCVVTDSSSDLLPHHAHAIGVLVVPNRIVLDGRRLRDGVDLTAAQYYAQPPKVRAAAFTEPASPADFAHVYQAAFRQGASAIVSIHVSGHLSHVVRHAVAARDALAPAPIHVIDSRQLGIGMWPAVIGASRIANLGASAQEVHQHTVSMLSRTHAFVMVESLDALRRSGRIRRLTEVMGNFVDAHPIFTLRGGEAALVETVHPRKRAVLRLCELAGSVGAIETLIVCGTSIEMIAEMEALLARHFTGTIQKTWLGPVNGANMGPAIAVSVVVQD
jgi:DegV family protein with EDD domain